MLTERKKSLLSAIIREHIDKAEPVGSFEIVDKCGPRLSSATIRNEMHALEKEGYLYQPHTSAGRVPSEKGWRYYLDNFLKEMPLAKKEKGILNRVVAVHRKSHDELLKQLARNLAELSSETAFIGFTPDNVYYTGLANLFQQPEFREFNLIYDISRVVDHLDEVMTKIFKEVDNEIKILIGKQNPFGEECGAILAKYKFSGRQEGMFGILGPMRQAYDYNLSLLKYSRELIKNL